MSSLYFIFSHTYLSNILWSAMFVRYNMTSMKIVCHFNSSVCKLLHTLLDTAWVSLFICLNSMDLFNLTFLVRLFDWKQGGTVSQAQSVGPQFLKTSVFPKMSGCSFEASKWSLYYIEVSIITLNWRDHWWLCAIRSDLVGNLQNCFVTRNRKKVKPISTR